MLRCSRRKKTAGCALEGYFTVATRLGRWLDSACACAGRRRCADPGFCLARLPDHQQRHGTKERGVGADHAHQGVATTAPWWRCQEQDGDQHEHGIQLRGQRPVQGLQRAITTSS